MKTIKRIGAILVLTLGIASASAEAAEVAGCQLRNLSFVSTISDGSLVINAEVWGGPTTTRVGFLSNAVFCNVNTPSNNVSAQVCRHWYQVALTAMLTDKKIFFSLPGSVCPTGNPGASPPVAINPPLTGLNYFGLNH